MYGNGFRAIIAVALGLVVTPGHGFSPNPWYYDYWCDNEGDASLKYLDDSKCAKVFPSSFSREWQCSVAAENNDVPSDGYEADSVPLSEATVDTTTLEAAGVPTDVQLCIILVKRTAEVGNGTGTVLYNKRLCAGGGESLSFETWSSSKFLAMGNAAGKLREECSPEREFGLDTYEENNASSTPSSSATMLGDLATIVASYDTTQGFTSNSVASYFHDLGWRARAHDLIARSWLALNPAVSGSDAIASASLGGNYGEPSPSALGFHLSTLNDTNSVSRGASAFEGSDVASSSSSDAPAARSPLTMNALAGAPNNVCDAQADAGTATYANSLTALALAEAHRRIVLHREVSDPLPSATWTDVQAILYGAGKQQQQQQQQQRKDASSRNRKKKIAAHDQAEDWPIMFEPDGVDFGGLTADPAIFIQAALDEALPSSAPSLTSSLSNSGMETMDIATGGRWRIFSKLGAGYSSSRSVGEIVTTGCKEHQSH